MPKDNIPGTSVNGIPNLCATTLEHSSKSTLSRELHGRITCVEENMECWIQFNYLNNTTTLFVRSCCSPSKRSSYVAHALFPNVSTSSAHSGVKKHPIPFRLNCLILNFNERIPHPHLPLLLLSL